MMRKYQNKDKKGQAALEFLTTYGWAFLVILIMIGAFAYFGVLNPKQFLPDTCTVPAPFVCEDKVLETGEVLLKIRHDSASIVYTDATVEIKDTGLSVSLTDAQVTPDCAGTPSTCTPGVSATLTLDVNAAGGTLPLGKQKVMVTLGYYNSASGVAFEKPLVVELVGTIVTP